MEKVPVFRVIIAGSRNFCDYPLLKRKMDWFLREKAKTCRIVIISGTAKGADRLGEKYAQERGYQCQQYPAAWDALGRKAGIVRNAEMAHNADAAVLFWDGISHGTKNMKDLMEQQHKPVRAVYFNR